MSSFIVERYFSSRINSSITRQSWFDEYRKYVLSQCCGSSTLCLHKVEQDLEKSVLKNNERTLPCVSRFRQAVLNFEHPTSNEDILNSLQILFAFLSFSQVNNVLLNFLLEEKIFRCYLFLSASALSARQILAPSETFVFREESTTRLSRISSTFT